MTRFDKPAKTATSAHVQNQWMMVCRYRRPGRAVVQRTLRPWASYLCGFSILIAGIGCGSATLDDNPPMAAANVPAQETSQASAIAPPKSSQGDQTPAQPKVTVPPPSAEQIERWTPAPFERLQLLAIREWNKTSFSTCVASTPDGEHFIVAGSRVLLWSVNKDEPEHVFLDIAPDGKDRVILSLAMSPDGKWFAAGDSTGMVRIWSLEDRKELVAKKIGSTGIQNLAISPDWQEIATISYDNEISVWSSAFEPLTKFKVNTNGLKRIEYAASKMLAAAGESTSLWNTGTGELVQELSPGRFSFALGRSPDSRKLIVGGKDSLRIWNTAESKQAGEITHNVSGSERIAFSPDGKYLATATSRSIQLWNLAEGRVTQVIDGFGWPIVGITWLPKTHLLVVASEIGCTRLWGTATHGTALSLKPLHANVAQIQPNPNAPSPQSAVEVIDLRTFPRLPNSVLSMVTPGDLNCIVPVAINEANSFYKYFLEKDGWTAAEAPPANPMGMEFRKNGFTVSVQCFDAGDGKTNVMVHNAGSYDVRRVPKFDGGTIETVYETADAVSYRTKSDIVAIETTLLRKLHATGWTGYSRLNSSHSERPDERDLNFLQNGTTLRVSIIKTPDQPSSYNIQYSLSSNNTSVPIPPDSGFVEFDGSTEPLLVAKTTLALDQAGEFYHKNLTAQGWLARETGRFEKEDHLWLTYIRNQSDLTIALTKLPDGKTLVRVGKSTGSLWELSQKKEEGTDKRAETGLEAADFPALETTHSVVFDGNEKSIEVTVQKVTLANAADQFTKSLAKLDWKIEEGGIRGEDYTLLRFKKGAKEISLRARPKDGNAVVNFQGDGLLWNKELPTGKQVLSYEAWLRQNKQPAGLELLDRYAKEMAAIKAP